MRTLSPSAVITLRDALTAGARTTRTRQQAMPSWLSIRTRPMGRTVGGWVATESARI